MRLLWDIFTPKALYTRVMSLISAHIHEQHLRQIVPFGPKRDAAKLLLTIFEEALWPTRCAICDKPDHLLCPSCQAKLSYIDSCRACKRCGAPFGAVQCSECNPVMLEGLGLESLPYTVAASAVMLDERARRIVSVYKDRGERRLARVMAKIMCNYADPAWLREPLVLSYLPASPTALNRRGFDHAELIALEISRILDIPCANLLERPRTRDQRSLTRKDRAQNMEKALKVHPRAKTPQRVLLIDDVYTTGSSLYAASRSLSLAGTEEIFCLTFARA